MWPDMVSRASSCALRATEHAGMMPDRPGALEERIRQIRSDIRELNQQREVARIKLSRLEAMQKQPDAEGPPTPASEGQPTNRRGMHADLGLIRFLRR